MVTGTSQLSAPKATATPVSEPHGPQSPRDATTVTQTRTFHPIGFHPLSPVARQGAGRPRGYGCAVGETLVSVSAQRTVSSHI